LGRLPVSRPKPDHNKKQNAGAQPDNVRPSQLAGVPRCPGNENDNRQNDYHDCKKNVFQRHGVTLVGQRLSFEKKRLQYAQQLHLRIDRDQPTSKSVTRISGGDTPKSQESL
jgi:hypothetical protein